MIRRFIEKLMPSTRAPSADTKASKTTLSLKKTPPKFAPLTATTGVAPKRVEVTAAEHGIKLAHVDQNAIDVCNTLQEAGYEAYIVGGAVRDLLLGLRPKDFDVATDATPEEVKKCFRRAFIIGRRFRIVHVVFGRGRESDVIEVTTFRANVDHAKAHQVRGNEKNQKAELMNVEHAVDASGRVLRDNIWGSQGDDATRRDFTVNAMYYDPYSEIVVDYHGGLADAKAKCIRMIGEPAERYREDPIRIIRAVRFAAKLSKLGFNIDKASAAPLSQLKGLLADVPPSRMFDEMLKLFQTGHALASVAQLQKLGLQSGLYPLQDLLVARAEDPFVRRALEDTDARVAVDKPVAPSFLLACLLWQDVRSLWQTKLLKNANTRIPAFVALQEAVDEVFESQIGDISGRGKLGIDMREIWMMQPRFEKRTGKFPHSLCTHPRFRAAWDFLHLRAMVGEVPHELVAWWELFHTSDEAARRTMQAGLEVRAPATPKTPKTSKTNKASATKPAARTAGESSDANTKPDQQADSEDLAVSEHGDEPQAETDAPVKKRRRRRSAKPKTNTGEDGANPSMQS